MGTTKENENKSFSCKHGCEIGCSYYNFGVECEQEILWKEENY